MRERVDADQLRCYITPSRYKALIYQGGYSN